MDVKQQQLFCREELVGVNWLFRLSPQFGLPFADAICPFALCQVLLIARSSVVRLSALAVGRAAIVSGVFAAKECGIED